MIPSTVGQWAKGLSMVPLSPFTLTGVACPHFFNILFFSNFQSLQLWVDWLLTNTPHETDSKEQPYSCRLTRPTEWALCDSETSRQMDYIPFCPGFRCRAVGYGHLIKSCQNSRISSWTEKPTLGEGPRSRQLQHRLMHCKWSLKVLAGDEPQRWKV